MRSILLLPFVLGAAVLPAQSVLVVDRTDPTAYPWMQAAVDAASPGDTVLVVDAVDVGLSITKPLTVIAEEGATPGALAVSIRNIAAGEVVVLRGLTMSPLLAFAAGSGVGTRAVLDVRDCAGEIWIEDCHAAGARNQSTHIYWAPKPEPLRITNCASVVLLRSTFRGSTASTGVIGSGSHYPGHGAVIENSDVYAYESSFVAGDSTTSPPSRGVPGILAVHARIYLQQSTAQGGLSTCARPPGEGVTAIGSTAVLRHLDSTLLGSPAKPAGGGCPAVPEGLAINLIGASEDALTGVGPGLTVEPLRREGELVTFTVSGTPGNILLLVFSAGASFQYQAIKKGPLLVQLPLVYVAYVVPPAGSASFSGPIPELGPFEGVNLFTQVLEVAPGPVEVAGPGRVVTMLDSSF